MSDNVEYHRQVRCRVLFAPQSPCRHDGASAAVFAGISLPVLASRRRLRSGRDAMFAEQGFEVTAFDATPELTPQPVEHCGFPVSPPIPRMSRETSACDGIGAARAAPCPGLRDARQLSRLWAALAPGTSLYVSLKQAEASDQDNGRRHGTLTKRRSGPFRPFAEVRGVELWLTSRFSAPERDEVWIQRAHHWASATVERPVGDSSPARLDHLRCHTFGCASRAPAEVETGRRLYQDYHYGLWLPLPDPAGCPRTGVEASCPCPDQLFIWTSPT